MATFPNEVPTVRRFDRSMSVFFAVAGMLCVAGSVSIWRDSVGVPAGETPTSLVQGRSATYYAAVYDAAILDRDWPMAVATAKAETTLDSSNANAWNRLVFAETAQTGRPSRPALEALLFGYERAPFAQPPALRWRIEYAARHWSSMPDIIQEKAIADLNVLGGIPQSWRVREKWCQEFVEGALKVAACDSLRGTDL